MKDILFICPICKTKLSLSEGGRSLICEKETKPHCFDISSAGYVNLDRNHIGGGDSKECVKSRSAFLALGHYEPIAKKICEIICNLSPYPSVILDAGCGEGYYTEAIARQKNDSRVMGIDISKSAVEHASKMAKRENQKILSYCVSSIFELPLKNDSVDIITSIFAPCPNEEFSRVLKNGGYLIIAAAGERHLLGLKKAVYDDVYMNSKRADMPHGEAFELVLKERLSYMIHLKSKEEIANLFAMTPYYYRTSMADKEKLAVLDFLDTEVEIEFSVYRKNG